MNIIAKGPGRHRVVESPKDIICCVKRYAADEQLSQEMWNLSISKKFCCVFVVFFFEIKCKHSVNLECFGRVPWIQALRAIVPGTLAFLAISVHALLGIGASDSQGPENL